MNPELLSNQAADAIAIFLQNHDTGCLLGFFRGLVTCVPYDFNDKRFQEVRRITKWQCQHGFTSKEWSKIGEQLDRAQKENPECHQHPKL